MCAVPPHKAVEGTGYGNEGESAMNNATIDKFNYTNTCLLWDLNDNGWLLEICQD